ncbi:uncharacterized protein LOC107053955 isoform X2 [Gallus gallus]|uniref:uncharacterized protein LOC107053955 isoform X2 n=1 Tax=Gallus gallus TaxID=9031 RepID=UPI001AE28150|nr:uncharacterized protein LOC107053955 isoform X2 [Gallus gallus]
MASRCVEVQQWVELIGPSSFQVLNPDRFIDASSPPFDSLEVNIRRVPSSNTKPVISSITGSQLLPFSKHPAPQKPVSIISVSNRALDDDSAGGTGRLRPAEPRPRHGGGGAAPSSAARGRRNRAAAAGPEPGAPLPRRRRSTALRPCPARPGLPCPPAERCAAAAPELGAEAAVPRAANGVCNFYVFTGSFICFYFSRSVLRAAGREGRGGKRSRRLAVYSREIGASSERSSRARPRRAAPPPPAGKAAFWFERACDGAAFEIQTLRLKSASTLLAAASGRPRCKAPAVRAGAPRRRLRTASWSSFSRTAARVAPRPPVTVLMGPLARTSVAEEINVLSRPRIPVPAPERVAEGRPALGLRAAREGDALRTDRRS